ncbi:O-methyltransferase [Phytophthora palmivora]|uniref:O-methyltransferase n=1 Tax=Phytophthora palmivora TaxID=4796 RepID=A0A2P4YJ22_9STRA|nr:O-methyltransferase [Phytophthora palmivora]
MQGKFLSFLVQTTAAQRVLEIGCFTGYSALCLANGLSPDGSLITCDIDMDTMAFAQKFFCQSSRADQITAVNQDGLEFLKSLSTRPEPFDLIFVDANKRKYREYYDLILEHQLLHPSGLLVFDNTLFRGRVAAYANGLASNKERIARALAEFNTYVMQDPRTSQVVLPLWDGLTLLLRLLCSTQRAASEEDGFVAHCEHVAGPDTGLFDGAGGGGGGERDDGNETEELHGTELLGGAG